MQSTKNSIFTIHPYIYYNTWVFDDEGVDLVREPFVAGADDFLDIVAEGSSELTVIFSETKFPDAQYTLEYLDGDIDSGTTYNCVEIGHTLWLCPALGKYFSESPKTIYLKIKL